MKNKYKGIEISQDGLYFLVDTQSILKKLPYEDLKKLVHAEKLRGVHVAPRSPSILCNIRDGSASLPAPSPLRALAHAGLGGCRVSFKFSKFENVRVTSCFQKTRDPYIFTYLPSLTLCVTPLSYMQGLELLNDEISEAHAHNERIRKINPPLYLIAIFFRMLC